MVDRRVPAAATGQRLVPAPLVGVHHRPRLGGRQDRGVDRLLGPGSAARRGSTAGHWCGRPPPVPEAGRCPKCRGPWPGSPAAAEGRVDRCAAPLFSPAFWYISSASAGSSGSGERSAAARARAWMACRSRSRCWRLTPTSRASFAVGTPCAIAPEDQEDLAGAEVCTLPEVPVNTLKTRRQPLQR